MQATPLQIARPLIAVAWGAPAPESWFSLVLLARETGAGGALELVELPPFAGGRRRLAALVDAESHVVEWLECWTQATQGLATASSARAGLLTNLTLDQTWALAIDEFSALRPDTRVAPPAAPASSEAWVVDLESRRLTRLVHPASRQPWRLCRNDAQLAAAGKPAYSGSLERWFSGVNAAGETVWVEQDLLFDREQAGATLVGLESGGKTGLSFNVSAGHTAFWRLSPLGLEAFADELRGAPRAEPAETSPAETLAEIERSILSTTTRSSPPGPALFPEAPALENLYLRLALWQRAAEEVLRASRAAGRPFFNLSVDSFRVDLLPAGSLLPPAWAFRIGLAKPGQAIPFPGDSSGPLFVAAEGTLVGSAASRFRAPLESAGTLRISQATEAENGQLRLEGILDAAGMRDAAAGSLVCVELPLDGREASFVALVDSDAGGRTGTRFKATTERLSPSAVRELRAAVGPRRNCRLSLLQPVSPAYDVYLLGRVGLRILLASDAAKLGELEDDFFELAALLPRPSGINHLRYLVDGPELNDRLRRLLEAKAWAAAPDSAGLPPELWFAVVHELMEFVAVSDEAEEPMPGDASPGWLAPLARRCASLSELALHVRGLLCAPQAAHEEISRVVRRFV